MTKHSNAGSGVPVDCVFCGLLDGGDARWVAKEARAVAFLPRPGGELAPGHTLAIPRAHAVGVLDAEPGDLNATIALVQRVGRAMKRAWAGPVSSC